MAFLHKTIISLILLFTTIYGVFAQNLVPNNSFDEEKKNVKKFTPDLWNSDFLYGSYFIRCNAGGTCDFYHGSGKPRKTIFLNPIKPKTGICYAGFYTYSYSGKRGYWGIKLKEKLQKNHQYKVKIFVNRYKESAIFLKTIQILFTEGKTDFVSSKYPVNLKKYNTYRKNKKIVNLSNKDNTWLNKGTKDWVKISGIYTAKGNEDYITIGNFRNNKNTKHLYKKDKDKIDSMAYYFIDDISIIDVTNTLDIEIGKPLVLKNIFFKSGKHNLLPSSFPELKKLETYLKENPEKRIEISGHTDNVGSYDYNMKLSEQRAKALAIHLILKGINKNRLAYIGYGSSKPIDVNTTTAGRKNNRRVEVKIIKE